MPRVDRTTYDFACDFPGCPEKGTTTWSRVPPGWVTFFVGASRGGSAWNSHAHEVIACSGAHARVVARTRFEGALDDVLRDLGVKT